MIRSLRKSALPIAALALAISSAYAAPVGPADATFYTQPAALAGAHGDLIQYRPTTVKLGADAPATKAFNVLYQSTDSQNKPNAVSGTVLVPTAAWTGTGARPVILYAVGTHGLAQGCAPSRQFESGKDYENANINAALKAGYAVLVTDYAGYLTGSTGVTYLAGQSQGHAVLDIFKAATSIPSVGIAANAPVGIWGFSQGGQSAAWAAETLSAYAPELNVKGVAAGGVPANFPVAAAALDGNLGAAFLASGVAGLSVQYRAINTAFNLLATPAGKDQIAKLKTQCVFTALFDPAVINHTLASYTVTPDAPLSEILDPVTDTLVLENLGKSALTVPMYQYHGQADEFIPLAQDIELKRFYCSQPGAKVQFDLFPSEHIVTQFQAAPNALSWLADRFAGKTAPSSCSTNTTGFPTPTNTNKTPGGHFVVALDKWPLAATVGLKTLGQTVVLPDTSSFTATTDITAKTLNGSLNVPDFKQSLKILGIGATIGLRITPVGATTGTASLDNDGKLHVHGVAKADITVTSVWGIPFGECKTVTPVEFPLDFDGDLASLGNGNLTFKGTTTFSQVKGCAISAILSGLMSGSGQTYSFTVKPPAPKSY